MKTVITSIAGLGLFLLTSMPAMAYKLPKDIPARDQGLWQIEKSGNISDGKTTFAVQKIWHICLDAKADRALHELEIREQQASVANLNETCNEPQPTLSGNVLSWTMHCSGPSPIEDKIGKTDIQHSTTFTSGNETHAESIVVNRDNLIQSHSRFLTHMKRLGTCDGKLRAGNMIFRHWKVNNEETLKARERRNVYNEIADYKTFRDSRLDKYRSSRPAHTK